MRLKEEFSELVSMQASKKNPNEGDVFIVQPKKGIYFYGKVIKTNIQSINPFFNKMNLIYLYKESSQEVKMLDYMNSNQLLIPPVVVNNQGWLKGYFMTIGNIAVTDEEYSVDFGFWSTVRNKYFDLSGNELKKEPKYHSIFGLGSYGVVGRDIQKVLQENPELLKV